MRSTITTLLLAGVVALSLGVTNSPPNGRQDLTYPIIYDDGFDGPTAWRAGFGATLSNQAYRSDFQIAFDCDLGQQVSCVKLRICPPPATYQGHLDIWVNSTWKADKNFPIMAGVEWHTICLCEKNIIVTSNGSYVRVAMSVNSGNPANVWLIRDNSAKVGPHPWNKQYAKTGPVSHSLSGWSYDDAAAGMRGDLMIRLEMIQRDVEVQSVWLEPAGPYTVGQTVTLKARLLNNDNCDRGFLPVKTWFSRSGVPSLTVNIDFDPNLDYTYSRSFTIPSGWGNKTTVAYAQIVTSGQYEWITTNDKKSVSFFVNPILNVGSVSITTPAASVTAGVAFFPRVTVKNYGQTTVSFPVDFKVYDDANNLLWTTSYTVSNLLAGYSRTFSFTSSYTPAGGDYVAVVKTNLSGDIDGSNDTKSKDFTAYMILRDVGCSQVVSPAGTIERGDGVDVKVQVENYGTTEASFAVKCDLTLEGKTYHYSQNVDNLAGGATQEVIFVERRFRQVGEWTVKAWTELEGDRNGQNNTAQHGFQVTGQEGWFEAYNVPGTIPVNKGAAMTSTNSTDFILLKGKKDGQLYSFLDALDAPSTIGTMPQTAGQGTQIACLDGILYVLAGNKSLGFYAVNVATGQWTQLENLPSGASGKAAKAGASMAIANGMIYVLKGNKTNEVYRYNPVAGIWEAMTAIPGQVKDGAALVSDGNRLFALTGKGYEFYTFDGLAWQRLADLPAKAKAGTALGYLDGVVYAAVGGSTLFYSYDALMNVWNPLQEVPTGMDNKKVGAGSAMTSVNGSVLLLKKAKTTVILAYSPESYFCRTRPSAEGVQAASSGLRPVVSVASPVHNLAYVSSTLPGPVSIQLYTSTGALVRTLTTARGSAALDVSDLASGTYLLKVSSGSQTVTRQVVIQ